MTINRKMLELGFIWNVSAMPVNKPEVGSRQGTGVFHSVLTIRTFLLPMDHYSQISFHCQYVL
jgi:hypothetical protein